MQLLQCVPAIDAAGLIIRTKKVGVFRVVDLIEQ
jgi:hypothetical protein